MLLGLIVLSVLVVSALCSGTEGLFSVSLIKAKQAQQAGLYGAKTFEQAPR